MKISTTVHVSYECGSCGAWHLVREIDDDERDAQQAALRGALRAELDEQSGNPPGTWALANMPAGWTAVVTGAPGQPAGFVTTKIVCSSACAATALYGLGREAQRAPADARVLPADEPATEPAPEPAAAPEPRSSADREREAIAKRLDGAVWWPTEEGDYGPGPGWSSSGERVHLFPADVATQRGVVAGDAHPICDTDVSWLTFNLGLSQEQISANYRQCPRCYEIKRANG